VKPARQRVWLHLGNGALVTGMGDSRLAAWRYLVSLYVLVGT